MEKEDYLALLATEDYDFLRKEPQLNDNLILLVVGGSRAYGTNNEDSDVDIRGITLDLPKDILGRGTGNSDVRSNERFEQFLDKKTDTVIYTLSKFIEMALGGNPNILEILGVREQDVLYASDIGRKFLTNKEMFYSKRIIQTVGGYAEGQLRRLENAICKNGVPQPQRESHINESLNRFLSYASHEFSKFDKEVAFKIMQDVSMKETLKEELFVDINLTHYPLRDFNAIVKEMRNIVAAYDKNSKGYRNNKKDDTHLNKHAMHLIRLYLMGIDLVGSLKLSTYREKDIPTLLEIRNGKFMDQDGSYKPEFQIYLNELKDKFNVLCKTTALPDLPNFQMAEEFKMEALLYSIEKGR
ncbi:MAG: nucleotidyltransferase domain-containing protein [Erysipelotrichaceae bacterium]